MAPTLRSGMLSCQLGPLRRPVSRSLPLVWPAVRPLATASQYKPARQPWQHQIDATKAVLGELMKGRDKIGLSVGTGGGKTLIAAEVSKEWRKISAGLTGRPGKILILDCSIYRAHQTRKFFAEYLPDLKVEIEQGDHKASPDADVVIAMFQSLREARLARYDPREFCLIIFDEGHHCTAMSYVKILNHFNSSIRLPKTKYSPSPFRVPVISLSATLYNSKGLSLLPCVNRIAYHISLFELIELGVLAPLVWAPVQIDLDLHGVEIVVDSDEYNPSTIEGIVNTKHNNDLIVTAWQRHASDRRSTIAFVNSKAHAAALSQAFNDQDIRSESLTDDVKGSKREQVLRNFKDGTTQVLVNINILTEGTDMPYADCLLNARPTISPVLYTQMIGRIARKYPGKQDGLILDLMGRKEDQIIDTPRLHAAPSKRSQEEDDEKKEKFARFGGRKKEKDNKQESQDGKLVEEEYLKDRYASLKREAAALMSIDEVRTQASSPNRWVFVKPSSFVISAKRQDTWRHIELLMVSDNEVEVWMQQAGQPKEKLHTATGIEDAVVWADTYIAENNFAAGHLIQKDAAWRQNQATDEQCDLIRRILPEAEWTKFMQGDPTKGEASDVLIRFFHRAANPEDRKVAEQQWDTLYTAQYKEASPVLAMRKAAVANAEKRPEDACAEKHRGIPGLRNAEQGRTQDEEHGIHTDEKPQGLQRTSLFRILLSYLFPQRG